MYLLVKNRDGRIVDATKQAERANVVSGEVFYTRSKSNPELNWLEKSNTMYATKEGCSPCNFPHEDGRESDKYGAELVDSDTISLTASSGNNRQYTNVNDNSEFTIGYNNPCMTYGDFKSNFSLRVKWSPQA